CQQAYSAPRTF
nr:immunoglobulin light chain junction region [Macaca mulatta]MOW52365.1 immunoglobulin light chain junction region [Macaca mulatta]MOW52482.1 immunoglobulin light chain junction region [Macaca mulatta]MOW53039.1 immunoglobulin light chain junction region [Macaca mulatta]MOX57691.1 immunoglobulin light chain junction region [Macaca mulatta]